MKSSISPEKARKDLSYKKNLIAPLKFLFKEFEDQQIAAASLGQCSTWYVVFLTCRGTGRLVAILVSIKRKSLAPLFFFGTIGTMLDIIMGINQCEREHAECQMKLQEEQRLVAESLATGAVAETES